ELGADEAAADHDHAGIALCRRAQAAVVVECPEVDDLVVPASEPAGNAAGREQQLLVDVLVTLVVGRAVAAEIERDHAAPEDGVGATQGGVVPDRLLVAACPELLRERRTLVRRV